ncbi:flagellar modification protein FlmH [Aeromonas allosaccharophila]|uniref:GNAT family N-acetyltransferase n=1 Tax=Aeromonas allosaccharophila TaxID=656 RepID=UPI001BD13DA9|nr:GNAT family N-acetyltransferase [Aeromonas allosaccharophila]MBS4694434.1 flagellar modification protein FlmH [Aeromonas allosaccharophila]
MSYGVELCPIQAWDLPTLRRWRNQDEVRLQMVDQTLISSRQQRQWFVSLCERADQQHWVLRCRGIRAGYVNLKGERSAPLQNQMVADAGLYLGNSAVRHPMLAIAAALSQLDQGFDRFNLGCIRTLVREDNRSALRLNEQLGYRQYGAEGGFLALELQPADYYAARERLRRFFR